MIDTSTSRYDDFSEENRKAIHDFLIAYASRGNRPSSVQTKEDNLVKMFRLIGPDKSYKTITNTDINEALFNSGWKPSSQEMLKRAMKQFLIHHNRKKIANNIVLNSKVCKKTITKDEILTVEEIEKLLNCYNEPMNRAVIETLLLTGARLEEIQTLNVGSVRFEDDVVWFDLRKSKTQIRSVPIVPNDKNPLARYPTNVEAWLLIHPNRNNKDAPLFLSRSVEAKYYGNRVSKQGIERIVRRARTLTGITKRLYPHLCRHTTATFDGESLSEQCMNTKYGWVQGSTMVRRYCHVNEQNLLNALREHAGVIPRGYEETRKLREELEAMKTVINELLAHTSNKVQVFHTISKSSSSVAP